MEVASLATRHPVRAFIPVLVEKLRLCVENFTLLTIAKHVVHLVVKLKVFEVNFLSTAQLDCLKDLEVE